MSIFLSKERQIGLREMIVSVFLCPHLLLLDLPSHFQGHLLDEVVEFVVFDGFFVIFFFNVLKQRRNT